MAEQMNGQAEPSEPAADASGFELDRSVDADSRSATVFNKHQRVPDKPESDAPDDTAAPDAAVSNAVASDAVASDASPPDAAAPAAAAPDPVALNASAPAPAADYELPANPDDKTVWPREAFRSGMAPPRTVLEWVAANLWVQSVKPPEAPDSTAWGLLVWARASASNRSAFYQMWAKLLPTRAQVDEQDNSDDDGGELLDSIEFVYNAKRAAALRVSAEGPLREPPLSRETPPRHDRQPA